MGMFTICVMNISSSSLAYISKMADKDQYFVNPLATMVAKRRQAKTLSKRHGRRSILVNELL